MSLVEPSGRVRDSRSEFEADFVFSNTAQGIIQPLMLNLLYDVRRVFLLILGCGLFAMAARSVIDPDVWWHLRTGQFILQNHAVFRVDPYSFTRFGQPWVNHEWLSGVLIYALYRISGWSGLIATFAAFTSIALLFTFLRCQTRPAIAALVTVIGATASAPSWGVRPQILSILFLSIFLFVLDDFCNSSRHPNLIWCLPLFTLFWVNLHGGFATGPAMIALYIVSVLFDVVVGVELWQSVATRIGKLLLVFTACLAAVPLNPYGMKMYGYPLATLHSQAMRSSIQEWASPNFHEFKTLPLLILLLSSVLLLALSPRKLKPSALLLLLAGTAVALFSVRHIPIYVLMATPALGQLLEDCLRRAFQERPLTVPSQRRPLRKAILNFAAIAAIMVFALARAIRLSQSQSEVEARNFPTSAVQFLMQRHIPEPILNQYEWGGYLIWKCHPNIPVFIDGRADVYGDALLNEYVSTYSLTNNWQAPFERWGIQTVVVAANAPLASALKLRPGWTTVYADSQALVLVSRPGSKDSGLGSPNGRDASGSRNKFLSIPGTARYDGENTNRRSNVCNPLIRWAMVRLVR